MHKKFILLTTVALCCLQVYVRSREIEVERSMAATQEELFYLPSSRVLGFLSFGYENVLADLIWVKTVIYFSQQFVGLMSYDHLEPLLDTVTDLDPRFEKAYIWGGGAFLYNGLSITPKSIGQSNRLMEKGWSYFRNDVKKWRLSDEFWRIPFMIGFNYAVELREKEKGAPFIEAASKFEQAPSYVKGWASSLYEKIGQSSRALEILEEQLAIENLKEHLKLTDSAEVKEKIMSKIALFYRRLEEKRFTNNMALEFEKRVNRLYREYFDHFLFLPIGFFQQIHQDNISEKTDQYLGDYFDKLSSLNG